MKALNLIVWKFFSEWQTLRDNVALSAALQKLVITCYHSSYKNNILAVPFLCEANTFIYIVFLNTFDKIHVLVRMINFFS